MPCSRMFKMKTKGFYLNNKYFLCMKSYWGNKLNRKEKEEKNFNNKLKLRDNLMNKFKQNKKMFFYKIQKELNRMKVWEWTQDLQQQ